MKRRRFEPVAVLLCGLLCIAPAGAAELVLAGQEGTEDPPDPTEGASTEEDWNPVVTCTVPPGGDINDLLNCLLDEIATPPPGFPARQDFDVSLLPPPKWGVQILKKTAPYEIDRLALRENDPGIQTTELFIDKPDRVARIRLIDQQAQGGTVHITVNGTITANIISYPGMDILVNNAQLIQQLRAAGLSLTWVSPYVYVRDHHPGQGGVRRLQYRSTDPGIIRSDLGLFPEGDPVIPPEGTGGP